jgi:hypothetical protein
MRMGFAKTRRFVARFAGAVLAILGIVWIAQLTLLPSLVGREVRRALENIGFSDASFVVSNVSFGRAVVVRIATKGSTNGSIDAVVIRYSFPAILHGRLDAIELTGARLTLDAGGAIELGTAGSPDHESAAELPADKIELRSSSLVLRLGQQDYWLSTFGTLENDPKTQTIAMHLSGYAGNTVVRIDGKIDQATHATDLTLKCNEIRFAHSQVALKDVAGQLHLAPGGNDGVLQVGNGSRLQVGSLELVDWSVNSSSAGNPGAVLDLANGIISRDGKLNLSAILSLPDASLTRRESTVRAQNVDANVPLTIAGDASAISLTAAPGASVTIPELQSGEAIYKIPQAGISGTFHAQAGATIGGTWLSLMFHLQHASAQLGDSWLGDVSGDVPVAWHTGTTSGTLTAGNVGIASVALPGMKGQVAVDDGILVLDADWPLLKEAIIQAKGTVDLTTIPQRGDVSLTLPMFEIADPNEMAKLLPMIRGATVLGTFSGEGSIALSGGHLWPDLTLHAHDVQIGAKAYDLEIDGLSTVINVDGFSPLTTPGGQALYIASAHAGRLGLANGAANFRVESDHALLVERTNWDWEGGRIHTSAFRVDSTPRSLEMAIDGENLSLKSILSTFLPAEASGDGTLYGRLQIKIRWPQIGFGDGFLYSAPGGGTLALGSDLLTQLGDTLNGNDPRFANDPHYKQIKAKLLEAVADFRYDVLKLDMRVQPQGLVTQVYLNGHGRQQNGQPLTLTVNLYNIDKALTRYLIMQRPTTQPR